MVGGCNQKMTDVVLGTLVLLTALAVATAAGVGIGRLAESTLAKMRQRSPVELFPN